MKRIFSLLLILVFTISLVGGCSGESNEAEQPPSTENGAQESPSKEYVPDRISVIIPYNPGGGIDIQGRTAGHYWNNEGITDAIFVYENIAGNGGQVGLSVAIEQRAGDDHMLIPVSSTYVILNKIQGAEYSYKDFVLLGAYASDPNMIIVSADSGINSIEDLISKSKESQLVSGVSGVGSIAHVLSAHIGMEAGVDSRIVPFDGDSAIVVALLSGEIDFTVLNVVECSEYLESGDFKAIAVTTAERLPDYPDVPTLMEGGLNIEQATLRGWAMTKGCSQEAYDYWIEKVKELAENEAFQKAYIDNNQMLPTYMGPDEFTAYMDAEYDETVVVLTELGLAKN